MHQIRIALLAVIFAVGYVTSLQTNASDVSWHLRNYSKDDGLAQATITAIVEDKDGLIWVGTQNGIHRFDGYQFTVFKRETKHVNTGLKSDFIRQLLVDNAGQLWVGTANGLHRFLPDYQRFEALNPNKKGESVHALTLATDGSIWVGTSSGLYQIEEASDALTLRSFSGQSVTHLMSDQDNIFAVVDNETLYQLPNETLQPTRIYAVDANQSIFDLTLVGNQRLIATSLGLVLLQAGQAKYLFPRQLDSVMALKVDGANNIWASTGSDLFQIREDFQSIVNISANYRLNQIISIYVDSNRLIWLGSLNDGLYLHALNAEWIETVTATVTEHDTLNTLGSSVTAIAMDDRGVIWQGSNKGVAALDWQSRLSKRYPFGESHGNVESQVSVLYFDSAQQLWVGYRGGPLSKFNSDSQRFEPQLANINWFITSIVELAPGELLITTRNNGVFIFNQADQTIDALQPSNNVDGRWESSRFQSAMVFNKAANETPNLVWLGSFERGLHLFDIAKSTIVKTLSQANGLSDNLVISLLQANPQELYVGTTNGVSVVDLQSYDVVRVLDAEFILGETIYGIEQDDYGLFWLTTDNGIVQYNAQTNTSRLFSEEDGLPNNEFNSNAFFKNKQYLYAGGVKGLARFDTEAVPAVGKSPDVILSELFVSGKKVQPKEGNSILQKGLNQSASIALDYFQKSFSLTFSAINYQTPSKVNYRYQLSPFDNDWIEVNYQRRLATYTNLDPGRYEFIIQASLNGTDWGKIQRLVVDIAPPPWSSPLAYWIYVILTLTTAIFIYSSIKKKRSFERSAFEKISKKEQELSLALWGSGDEFWNFDVRANKLFRRNQLSSDNYQELQNAEDFEAAIHPDDYENVKNAMLSCIFENADSFELTYRLKGRNDEWFWVLGKGQVSERNPKTGRPLLISGANKNITKLKEAEQALTKANDELEDKVRERTKELLHTNNELFEALNELKSMQERLVESEKMASLGGMVAGIAHEINTPLGVAVTSISHAETAINQLIKKAALKSLTAKQFEELSNETVNGLTLAQRNLSRATDLINSFKQVSVDQTSEQIRSFNLAELVEDTIATLTPQFKSSKITVSCKVPTEITINSFPGVLSQVLVNFVTNSLTHAFKDKEKGEITIEVFSNSPDSVLIIYKDTGIGIGQEHWEKVFEPFYTTNRSQGSTGLGMHISYNLVTQKLQGEILLNSRVGAGVEFYISIPQSLNVNKSLSQ